MIPKIIHQTWINEDIPVACNAYVESVKTCFNSWDYKLWTDAACIKLLRAYYPEMHNAYLNCSNNGEKADIFRYCILHRYGGMYFDIDYECFKSFEKINNFENYELLLFNETEQLYKEFGSNNIKANCVMGAQKNAYFLSKVLQGIQNNIIFKAASALADNKLCKIDSTLFKTGPFLITKIFETHRKQLLNNECFIGTGEEFTSDKKNDTVFGVHHGMHSWIQ